MATPPVKCVRCKERVSLDEESIKFMESNNLDLDEVPLGRDAVTAYSCGHVYHKGCLAAAQRSNDWKCCAPGCDKELILGNHADMGPLMGVYWQYSEDTGIRDHIWTSRKCRNCGKACTPPKKCGRCKAVVYCGTECQHAHWDAHKKHCQTTLCPVSGELKGVQKAFWASAVIAETRKTVAFDPAWRAKSSGVWLVSVGQREKGKGRRWELMECRERSTIIAAVHAFNDNWDFSVAHSPLTSTFIVGGGTKSGFVITSVSPVDLTADM